MRAVDIEIGTFYRLRRTPHYGWFKPTSVIRPGDKDSKWSFIVVKGERTIEKNDMIGTIQAHRPRDIIKVVSSS